MFDSLSVVPARLARQGALDLIAREFPADTWFAVFKIYENLRLLQSFTSDPRSLATAVDFATSGDDARRLGESAPRLPAELGPTAGSPLPVPGPPVGTTPSAAVAGIAASVQARLGELASGMGDMNAVYALRAISESLEPIRGRKTILYFAGARQAGERMSPYYEMAMSAANRANVTIHTIDARGLDKLAVGGRSLFDENLAGMSAESASTGFDPSLDRAYTRPTDRPDTGGGPWMDTRPFQVDQMSGSFLERVAHDTGGLAIRNTNDLGAGLSRVVEELGEYYEIAYHPADPEPDGRFRRISVKVSGSDVKVRTREGYFATPRSSPGVEAVELPLIAALGASPPPRDFEHESGVLHFGAPRGEPVDRAPGERGRGHGPRPADRGRRRHPARARRPGDLGKYPGDPALPPDLSHPRRRADKAAARGAPRGAAGRGREPDGPRSRAQRRDRVDRRPARGVTPSRAL